MEKNYFHGSSFIVDKPDLKHSRTDIDFGKGFYLTADQVMASKWAVNKTVSILNCYKIDFSILTVKKMVADEEWLKYVMYNRGFSNEKPFDDNNYDVIIGPTADDKLFVALDYYIDGIMTTKEAIQIINCMKYSEQIVFKNDAAIQKGLVFTKYKKIYGSEKQRFVELMHNDRINASKKTKLLLQQNAYRR